MIARRNFRYLQTRALSFLAINCKMESQKHATRFDLRYDIYSGLWCHKPMKKLGFECDFVKLADAEQRLGLVPGDMPAARVFLQGLVGVRPRAEPCEVFRRVQHLN